MKERDLNSQYRKLLDTVETEQEKFKRSAAERLKTILRDKNSVDKQQPETGQRWRHINSKKIYFVTELGKLKFGGEWSPSVSYYNCEDYDYTMYTRTIDDFIDKFERVD